MKKMLKVLTQCVISDFDTRRNNCLKITLTLLFFSFCTVKLFEVSYSYHLDVLEKILFGILPSGCFRHFFFFLLNMGLNFF